LVEKQKDHNVINGVTLLNTCVICNNKFKPSYSMTNEPLCESCLEKGKSI